MQIRSLLAESEKRFVIFRTPTQLLKAILPAILFNNIGPVGKRTDITGSWTNEIITINGDQQKIVQLTNVTNNKSLRFLAGDDNVLFFLDPSGQLYTGNAEFSYILNR